MAKERSGRWPTDFPAAGFFLFLFYWVARTLVRLRPLLGAKLPSRPSAIFFWLPFLVYCAMIPWTTAHRPPDGDEPYNLLIAHSLAYDLDADLTNNYDQGDLPPLPGSRDPDPSSETQPGRPGQIYSRHNTSWFHSFSPSPTWSPASTVQWR